MVRFAPEHAVLFLCLCDLGSKERHKVATRNGAPQGKKGPQHTPSQTDTVVRFAPEHAVLFLRLCDLYSKERHKATTRNGSPQVRARAVSFASLRFA